MQQHSPGAGDGRPRAKVSAFVISFNRQPIIAACLAPLAFADEVIVVDKSSTDGTLEVAKQFAHRVITVPWSPVVEETRTFALSQCSHDWILYLNDDECLSVGAVAFIEKELMAPRADIYGIAQRHYILGIHDERAYYWPDFQPRLFRRGVLSFTTTVHSGYMLDSDRRYDVPPDEGVCVHHLSYRNVAEWISKTNRYTSASDRARVVQAGNDLTGFAHERLDFWRAQTREARLGGYPTAVALLRATYDIIDRLKIWEEEAGLDGEQMFRDFAARHAARFIAPNRLAEQSVAVPSQNTKAEPDPAAGLRAMLREARAAADRMRATFQEQIATLQADLARQSAAADKEAAARRDAETARREVESARDALSARLGRADLTIQSLRARLASTESRADLAIQSLRALLASTESAFEASKAAFDEIRNSTSWRITAPLRGIATRNPDLVRHLASLAERHPGLRRATIRLMRNIWRIGTLRPLVPRTPSVTVAEIQGPAAATASNPLCWFHIGDTVEWLSTHRHLTEVGKVTTEILAAVLSDPTAPRWHLSTMRGDNLVRWEPGGAPSGLGPAAALRALLNSSPPAPRDPHFGDHVLFTGVVWTPAYTALIERLRARGVRISVLLYDLIPLERPDLVSAAHVEGFAQWLRCAVVESELIFTSAKSTRVQLYRWAIAAGITPRNPVQVIRFGCSLTRSAEVATDPIVREPFVLCVGTINSRKNQLFLCNAWATLSTERPMPVLVLAGRDDLGLARADRDVATLLDQGRIRILSELDDVALDALYRAALFTVFPSLFEGYGLPVADSLAYGKLCLAADLPVIREHAGDLPWYFDPRQPASLIAQLRRVLDDVPARTAAKVRLAGWRPPSWRQTAQDMTHGILERLGMPHAAARRPIDFPMTLPVSTTEILDRAREWCVEEEPEVSIIVVNRNATEMTCACIQHIWANTTGVKYEILVADNGSDPEALHVLRDQGGGLRLLRLGVNRYFGEANNIAVEAARGRFVCLLNNDAFVTLGWLTNLLAALRATPNAGAVGPVFLFPDGMIQEAGALINTDGVPERLMRGADRGHCAAIDDRSVDCISAACLLLTRDLFLQAGGFDLAYEPAYYEDVDLCCKLAMLGYGVKLVAGVDVVHLEGPSTGEDAIPSIRKRALEELNRKKFLARWHGYLHCPDRAALAAARIALPEADFVPRNATPERRALLYSPHNFTAGGGERYLLTFAAALSDNYQVTIAATHRYSRLRLRQLAAEFGISLAGCDIAPLDELSGEWDVMVALGNHVVPPVAARGHRNFFICQFPFPLPAWDPSDWSLLAGYDKVLAYSDYTRRHIEAAMSQNPSHRPVQVLYPPVPLMSPGPAPKRTMILTVGRFFAGGHNKRHDLLIQAFQTLHAEYGEGVEFHLAGSSMPDPGHMDHLSCLQESTSGLPVFFHVNAAPPKLASLYQDAAIYWHGTGLEADLQASPELAEHFGIAIVESMSAGCVAFALNAGAAPEIITDDVDGCLYDTVEALVERSVALLRNLERRTAIGTCARRRAADFDLAHFTKAVRRMLT